MSIILNLSLEDAHNNDFNYLIRLLDKLVDEVVNDSNRFNQYQKMLSKNNQQRQNWLTKRRQENESRRSNGQEELPDGKEEVILIFQLIDI